MLYLNAVHPLAATQLPLITTVAAAFAAAWLLGLITQKLKLSPIVGYLLAGVAIGPYTPGLVADIGLAHQLAEIGVILLMFGVGLHFHLGDLLAVKDVAIPGAILQSLVATVLGLVLAAAAGIPLKAGLVLGMAMAVASTVVLIRVLTDHKVLDTTAGHVAIGWLIVEDVLTVIVLVLIPAMGTDAASEASTTSIWATLGWSVLKLVAMVTLLLWAGAKVIPRVMVFVARLRSRELFTLTVLVMAIGIAAGSYAVFGASMALGAFLAGMVVGQSPVSQQAAADALPLRDAFAVIFFASVGMMFNPSFLKDHPFLLIAGLGIVIIAKPLATLIIVAVIGYPIRVGLTVAVGLAQIGEFSFILSELGRTSKVIGDTEHNLLVACAIVSITVNPLLFKLISPIERWLEGKPKLWKLLNRRSGDRQGQMNQHAGELLETAQTPVAVIIGYGPVGRAVDDVLRREKIETVIVDLNMDTIRSLTRDGRAAIYGDAFNIEVMHQALARATKLIVTLPHSANRNPLIAAAKLINPDMQVFVRARYLSEQAELEQVGADGVVYEEAEAAEALAAKVLTGTGMDADKVKRETRRVRQRFLSRQ